MSTIELAEKFIMGFITGAFAVLLITVFMGSAPKAYVRGYEAVAVIQQDATLTKLDSLITAMPERSTFIINEYAKLQAK